MSLSNTFRTTTVTVVVAAAIALGILGSLIGDATAAEAASSEPTAEQIDRDLAAVRAATARYHRVEVAIADGFVAPHEHDGHPACVALPDGSGGMGYHFVNPQRLGDGRVDVREPEMLLYEKDAAGRFRLIGVEYVGDEGAALFGRSFTRGPAGYALHVWVWKHNPSGMFADWNPNVSC